MDTKLNISAGNLGPTQAIDFPTPPEGYDSVTFFKIGRNQLTECPTFPSASVVIDIKQNPITELSPIPASCRFIQVEGTQITGVPALPAGLIRLDMKRNQITKTPSMRHCTQLEHISFSFNDISEVVDFPPNVSGIGLLNNKIKTLPPLPATLRHFVARNNQLTRIPELPDDLEVLDLRGNPIEETFKLMLTTAFHGGNNGIPFPATIANFEDDHAFVTGDALGLLIDTVRRYYTRERRVGAAAVGQTFGATQAANSSLAGRNALGAPGGPMNLIGSFLTGREGSLAQQKAALGGGRRTRRKGRKQNEKQSRRRRN